MRIAWCTPFGVRSAIGQFSASVVKDLRLLGADVDICYPDGAGGRRDPDPGYRLARGGRTSDGEVDLGNYEVVFYNIGDHHGYHGDLLRLAERYPGIVILHDVSIIHLVVAYLLEMPPADCLRQLRRWYGDDAPGILAAVTTMPDWPWRVENAQAFPLTEIALTNALAVVTHSHFAASAVRDRYVGEVWTLPLPALHVGHPDYGSVSLPMVDDRMVVLQAGVVNINKRVPLVIKAFAASDLVDVAQLVVAGHVDHEVQADLKNQVNTLGLNGSVHLLGEVPDSVMYALRERADVATVLRDPCTEAASASLLDAMASGSAVVAVEIGHYSETPDDTLSLVPPPPTVANVSAELRRLVRTPGLAADIGSRARRWVLEECMPRKYAAGILDVVDRVGVFDMRRRLARDLATNLRRTGAGPESRLSVAVADAAAELMGGEPRRPQELLIDRNARGSAGVTASKPHPPCRVCQSPAVQHRFTLPVLVGRYEANYVECSDCHALQVTSPDWLPEAYARDDVLNANGVDGGRWIRSFSAFSYLAALERAGVFAPNPRVLDFGGGQGMLTQLLIDSGWDAWTHDPLLPSPAFATHRSLTSADLRAQNFDVIVALEVLEHLADVQYVRRQLQALLRPGGVLVISTGIYRPGHHDETWDYLSTDAGQHVTLWSKPALTHFGRELGMQTVAYWPGNEGFLVLMTPMSKSDLDGVLRGAADRLHDASHRAWITHDFDLRHAGVIEETPAVIEEVLPRMS